VSGNYQSSTAVEISTDGNTWIPETADTSTNWNSVAFGNGRFVAVGIDGDWAHGVAMESADGINWNPVTLPDNQTNFTSIVYGGGKFVAVGNLNGSYPDPSNLPEESAIYSADGISWSFGNGTVASTWESVTYGAGGFVAVGQRDRQILVQNVMRSDDGITWIPIVTSEDQEWRSVTFGLDGSGNGLFVAVSQNLIMTSSDAGVNWNIQANQPNDSWVLAIYADGKFIISGYSGNNGLLAVSSDGNTWTYQNPAIPRSWESAAYDSINNKLVLLNRNGSKMFTDLIETVPTYVLTITSPNWPSSTPITSMCDSCLIGIQAYLARSDGGILDYGSNPTMSLTASLENGSPVSLGGLGNQPVYWGEAQYNSVQGLGDGSTVGHLITFHGELLSDPSVQGDFTLTIVANDGPPTVTSTSATSGEFISIAPADQALPDYYSFSLTSEDSSNQSPADCLINANQSIVIYPTVGAPYVSQLDPNDPYINHWNQPKPTLWFNQILRDQNGIPSRILLPGLVDGCYYTLTIADFRQEFESTATTYRFLYSPPPPEAPLITIHNQSELEYVTQDLIDYPGANFVLGNSFEITDTSTSTAYVKGDFQGNFDGNNFTISGLTVPLFQQIGTDSPSTANGYVIHLNIRTAATGVAGQAILTPNFDHGIVSDVHAFGSLSVEFEIPSGGLIGQASPDSLIETSSASVNIVVGKLFSVQNGISIGGLVGYGMGTINSSASSGEIFYVNGSDSSGTVIDIGGLVGLSATQGPVYINNSQSSVNISMSNQTHSAAINLGGLVGTANTTLINSSLSTGNLLIGTSINQVTSGGFVGQSNGSTINSSFSSGTLTNPSGYSNSFIGLLDDPVSLTNSQSIDTTTLLTTIVSQLDSGQNVWSISPNVNLGVPYILDLDPSGFYLHESLNSYSPNLSFSPLDFSTIAIGTSQVLRLVVTVKEVFDDSVGFNYPWVIGDINSDFHVISGKDACYHAELVFMETCTVDIAFTPTSSGLKTAALGVDVSTSVGPVHQYLTLSASGTAAQISSKPTLTWTPHSAASNQPWRAITSSSNGLRVAAITENGYVYKSEDGGSTWDQGTRIDPANDFKWTSIASSADGSRLAASTYAYGIYISTNGGETWIPSPSSSFFGATDIASSANGMTLIVSVSGDSDGDFLRISTDGGESWSVVLSAQPREWSSVAVSDDGQKIIATEGTYLSLNAIPESFYAYTGSIVTSIDTGTTWTEQSDPGQAKWTTVSSNGDGSHLVAAAMDGDVWTSFDYGTSWNDRTQILGPQSWLSVSSNSAGDRLAAVANNGYIYLSADYGLTWETQTVPGQDMWTSVTSNADGTLLSAVATNADIWNVREVVINTVQNSTPQYVYTSPVVIDTSTSTTKTDTTKPSTKPTIQPNVQPTIEMKRIANYNFAVGSYVLSKASKESLKLIAAKINSMPGTFVLVYGNSDAQPSKNNTLLSKRRALAVQAFLLPLLKGKKLALGWFGASKPLVAGKSAAAYATNRREQSWIK